MMRKNALSKAGQRGFSLIEVIVVVAIMAVLGTVVVPQLLRYVNQNQAKACQVDREGILAVYERCIYAETMQLDQDVLRNMMAGGDAATEHEIKQFEKCPLGGTYTGYVDGDIAIIECSCDGHEEVVVDFAMWSGTELAEGIDELFTEPPAPSVPEPDEPSTEEPSTEEELPEGGGLWPYEDDPRWDGRRYPGQVVEIDVPTPVFTSKDGTDYVIVNRGNGKFPVHWEWNRGPETIDAADPSWEDAIAWSGVLVTDIQSIIHPTNPNAITGVNYGDIVVYNGRKYIYGSHDMSSEKNFPVDGGNGNNFYLVGE